MLRGCCFARACVCMCACLSVCVRVRAHFFVFNDHKLVTTALCQTLTNNTSHIKQVSRVLARSGPGNRTAGLRAVISSLNHKSSIICPFYQFKGARGVGGWGGG